MGDVLRLEENEMLWASFQGTSMRCVFLGKLRGFDVVEATRAHQRRFHQSVTLELFMTKHHSGVWGLDEFKVASAASYWGLPAPQDVYIKLDHRIGWATMLHTPRMTFDDDTTSSATSYQLATSS